jgi:hypothetical protein
MYAMVGSEAKTPTYRLPCMRWSVGRRKHQDKTNGKKRYRHTTLCVNEFISRQTDDWLVPNRIVQDEDDDGAVRGECMTFIFLAPPMVKKTTTTTTTKLVVGTGRRNTTRVHLYEASQLLDGKAQSFVSFSRLARHNIALLPRRTTREA